MPLVILVAIGLIYITAKADAIEVGLFVGGFMVLVAWGLEEGERRRAREAEEKRQRDPLWNKSAPRPMERKEQSESRPIKRWGEGPW